MARPRWLAVNAVLERERLMLDTMLPETPQELAAPNAEPHWACPDCGQPCRCLGDLRSLPHDPCSLVEP